MSYSDFTIDSLKEKFGVDFVEDQALFVDVSALPLSSTLNDLLQKYLPLALAMDTEKARSELIVAPLLAELKIQFKNKISLFSGIEFNVDSANGLTGRCDFIISKSKEQYTLNAPVVVLVEAKNDNIKSDIPQCVAEMIAARKYNEQRRNPIHVIYGVVSTGTNWKFLRLQGEQVFIDIIEYYIQQPDKIMGILAHIATS